MEMLSSMIPLLIPLAVIELGMRIYSVVNIRKGMKREESFSFDPILWLVIVILVNFGWVFYLIFGKKDE